MCEIIIEEIAGGLEPFVDFIEEKKAKDEFEERFRLVPRIEPDERTLGGDYELLSVLLTGSGFIASLVSIYLTAWTNKNPEEGISINLKMKKGGKKIKVVGKNLTTEDADRILKLLLVVNSNEGSN